MTAAPRRLVIEADGGSRGNPGPSGYGAVVLDGDTRAVLAERAEFLGRATNNVAEYRGLIAGLQAAAEIDPAAAIEVRMDSKLVVEQMSGRWKVKHPDMRPLAAQAAGLAGGRAHFTWIPRGINKHADRLANEAMDAGALGQEWVPPAAPSDQQGSDGSRTTTRASAHPESASKAAVPFTFVGWDPDLQDPARLLLVRHGQTPMTAAKKFSGLGQDPALSELGERQVRAVAARLGERGGIDAIVASPYRRTLQTAEAISAALSLPIEQVPALRECDFGDWEGLGFAEVSEGWPDELAAWLGSTSVTAPGGESFDQVSARVETARAELVATFQGRTVVVVSHTTPIKDLIRRALGAPPSALHRMRLVPASLSAVSWWADGGAELSLFNDSTHLVGLRSQAGSHAGRW